MDNGVADGGYFGTNFQAFRNRVHLLQNIVGLRYRLQLFFLQAYLVSVR
jgi:hypothetical protein